MWKVFLVDDEEIILNQIKQTVPWMDNGFEVIGMETNPDRAVSMVIELKPDVIISDLRMPQLDGHTFMRTVREEGLDVEFVMLISIPPPSAGGTNSNESVPTLYAVL